jgi:cytidylate kinase
VRGPFVIAVDGPAASGKGTIASRLGAEFGLPVLDTGLLYRAVGVILNRAGGDLDDAEAGAATARRLSAAMLDDPAFRTRAAGELASRVAVHPPVRAALLDFQRAFAGQPGGAVLDGRDIGTVIAPDAPAKLYVTAAPEVRAERRWKRRWPTRTCWPTSGCGTPATAAARRRPCGPRRTPSCWTPPKRL